MIGLPNIDFHLPHIKPKLPNLQLKNVVFPSFNLPDITSSFNYPRTEINFDPSIKFPKASFPDIDVGNFSIKPMLGHDIPNVDNLAPEVHSIMPGLSDALNIKSMAKNLKPNISSSLISFPVFPEIDISNLPDINSIGMPNIPSASEMTAGISPPKFNNIDIFSGINGIDDIASIPEVSNMMPKANKIDDIIDTSQFSYFMEV